VWQATIRTASTAIGWGAQAPAIEWDRYPSDEPRGNVLAVAYNARPTRVEGYNFR
jgi:hypothetical protein